MVDLTGFQSQTLPPLRQDLEIQLLGSGASKRLNLFDPLTHKYYELKAKSAALLSLWHHKDPARICALAQKQGMNDAQTALDGLAKFLSKHGLLQTSPNEGFDRFHAASDREHTLKAKVAKVAFYRLRLGSPEPLLRWLEPLASVMMSRAFTWLTVFVFVGTVLFLLQHPESLSVEFNRLISLEGVFGLGLAIALVKLFHELGHAFQAKRLGLDVPGCGIMFMIGFPMPFTELSDSWRLSSAKDRLRVDAGGILAELVVAVWAAAAFVFWPDGAIRSVFFAMATTSLVMSLFVNLNPLMRFDGYFLLADATGIKNLQPRAKDLADWAIRNWIFGLGAPAPEQLRPHVMHRMVWYGIAVKLYRMFLTLSISAIIYVLLPKSLAIPASALYVSVFLLGPILAEMRVWVPLIPRGLRTARTWRSVVVFAIILALFAYPFEQRFQIPARMMPERLAEFTTPPNVIMVAPVQNGGRVAKGELLWRMENPNHDIEDARLKANLATLQKQIERSAASADLRDQLPLLQSEIDRFAAQKEEISQSRDQLAVLAPASGELFLAPQPPFGHQPTAIGASVSLGHLLEDSAKSRWIISGYVKTEYVDDIGENARGVFWPTALASRPLLISDVTILQVPVDKIEFPEITRQYGGPIMTRSDAPDVAQTNMSIVQATFHSTGEPGFQTVNTGVMSLTGTPKSLLEKAFDRISRVLLREFGF